MKPTELVYSSHDRCEYLHRDWMVMRALESYDNRTIFYLPFSSGAWADQDYSWGTFSWYFDRFAPDGLVPRSFFWSEDLKPEDAALFFHWLANSEVVILGGGKTRTGIERYNGIGERFYDDPERFLRTLRERQSSGKLTVGYSAGADQLCEYSGDDSSPCYGLIHKVVVRLHFSPGGEGHIEHLARTHTDCLAFGLPNDSGIAANQGYTSQGTFWQYIQVITDNSWDKPEDQHHIKTRQGVKIEHRYPDGRDWKFNGGDSLLRLIHRDGGQEAWIRQPHEPTLRDYWSHEPTEYRTPAEIVGSR
ncbi:MAG: hypothetical protein AB1714_17210 [Acidobacteriota bacterium]